MHVQEKEDVRGRNGGDEELGSVGVLASVGHAKETLAGVPDLEVLVLELVAIDGLAAGAWEMISYLVRFYGRRRRLSCSNAPSPRVKSPP